MNTTITDGMLVRAASIFLLTVPPIAELPNDIGQVATKVRHGLITQQSALAYMEQVQYKFVTEYIFINKLINDLTSE